MSQTSETQTPSAEPMKARRTQTDWSQFERAGLGIQHFKCDSYRGNHDASLSCHANILHNAESVLRHMPPEAPAGWFKVTFKLTDGKPSPLWKQMEEAGIEIAECFCNHCRETVPISARRLIHHLKPHPGATRVCIEPQTLCFTLSLEPPETDDF